MVRPVVFNTSYADAIAQHDLNGSGNIDTNAELTAIFADPNAGGATAGRDPSISPSTSSNSTPPRER